MLPGSPVNLPVPQLQPARADPLARLRPLHSRNPNPPPKDVDIYPEAPVVAVASCLRTEPKPPIQLCADRGNQGSREHSLMWYPEENEARGLGPRQNLKKCNIAQQLRPPPPWHRARDTSQEKSEAGKSSIPISTLTGLS
jgi:hypothetical protein